MATLPNLGLETMETGLTLGREVFDGDMEILDAFAGAIAASSSKLGLGYCAMQAAVTTPYSATGDYFLAIPIVVPSTGNTVGVVRVTVYCEQLGGGTTTFQIGNREDTGAGGFDSFSVSLSNTQRTNSATDAGVSFDATNHTAFIRVTAAGGHSGFSFVLWSA